MAVDRRRFLQLLGVSAVASTLSESIAKALSISANNSTGTIADVEHIIFLMQENRSFDHYFGTLQGVRGFGDPRAVKLTTGNPIFYQPDGRGGYVLPFRPRITNLGLQFLQDLPHDWNTTHAAWNQGNYDQWVPTKSYTSMAYLQRNDLPFQYALADAFTICDAYHCSLIGPTDPNRYHMFTGWTGNDGKAGGPAVDNGQPGFSWTTFPEVLEAAGIAWKVYQDVGTGLNAAGNWGGTSDPYIGNYADNSLLHFEQYQNAQPGSALYENARTGTNVAAGGTLFDNFRADVLNGSLPQVSWIVAPEAYTEHPNWPPNYGAYYISEILNALTANPDVWSKTVFFIMYDENDGFFDHAVPPTPPQTVNQGLSNVSITNEIYPGTGGYPSGPYGLGPRVPMLVISPWSRGGCVSSEVFDHTSMIRFVQKRFGTTAAPLTTPNITAWRSALCGDLTSAFNFATPNSTVVSLPSTAAYTPPDAQRHSSYVPTLPVVQKMPVQEVGVRPACPVPYVLSVMCSLNFATAVVNLQFINNGRRAANFHVRSGSTLLPPRSYTTGRGTHLNDVWNYEAVNLDAYDLSVHGPNGFYREYQGTFQAGTSANLQSTVLYNVSTGGVTLSVHNAGALAVNLQILNVYTKTTITQTVNPAATFQQFYALGQYYGWYDFVLQIASDPTFRQQLAGHLETGAPSMTDPGIATGEI